MSTPTDTAATATKTKPKAVAAEAGGAKKAVAVASSSSTAAGTKDKDDAHPRKPHKKATDGKPALAITTGLKKRERPGAKKHKHGGKSERVLRYEKSPMTAFSPAKLKRLALSHGVRMLTADGYQALRAIAEHNALEIIVVAMTMTDSARRRIVTEKDLKYALDLHRQ